MSNNPIEQHTSDIYTKKIFLEVQVEIIEALNRCCIKSMDTGHAEHKYFVDDRSSGVFFVAHNMVDDTIVCSCKKFVKVGLVCRHMFVVMHNIGLKSIPQKYIVGRWLKDAGASVITSDGRKAQNKPLVSEAFRCIAIAEGNESLTESLLNELKSWADANETQPTNSVSAKERTFQMFYGAKLPTEINVHPPDPVKTKGKIDPAYFERKKCSLLNAFENRDFGHPFGVGDVFSGVSARVTRTASSFPVRRGLFSSSDIFSKFRWATTQRYIL
ncbi:protein FAR1-RELATED SEQUENCE 1-like [Salvia miltiorrhiza]|uniref:protein FAR1-RELATED SEQUENCE 1-like n=1 Tax=Salvia miltiorrhiza TaxID=226208 RepID=UPI0025AC2E54|nr:protein FAR1-RELATED SEQUENCE 1-like [Salvia miltiorrhiza]